MCFLLQVCAGEDSDASVSRTGYCSLFQSLAQACPFAIRGQDPYVGRHGLTEVEFNKVLERNGFTKLRAKKSFKMDGQGEDALEDGGERTWRGLASRETDVAPVLSAVRVRGMPMERPLRSRGPARPGGGMEGHRRDVGAVRDVLPAGGLPGGVPGVPSYPRFFEELDHRPEDSLAPSKRKLEETASCDDLAAETDAWARPSKLLHAAPQGHAVMEGMSGDGATRASTAGEVAGEAESCGEDLQTEAHLRECLEAYDLEATDCARPPEDSSL
eukprot:704811-Hanusia_phi.AAC.1